MGFVATCHSNETRGAATVRRTQSVVTGGRDATIFSARCAVARPGDPAIFAIGTPAAPGRALRCELARLGAPRAAVPGRGRTPKTSRRERIQSRSAVERGIWGGGQRAGCPWPGRRERRRIRGSSAGRRQAGSGESRGGRGSVPRRSAQRRPESLGANPIRTRRNTSKRHEIADGQAPRKRLVQRRDPVAHSPGISRKGDHGLIAGKALLDSAERLPIHA